MERNENDIFDELVRGKLSNYTEDPEPQWIRSIQAKKTRAVNLYQLYRLMLIAVIVGAGIFAGIQLMPYQSNTQINAGEQTLEQHNKAVQAVQQPSTATTSQNAEFASAKEIGVPASVVSSSPVSTVLKRGRVNSVQSTPARSVNSSLHNNSTNNTSDHKNTPPVKTETQKTGLSNDKTEPVKPAEEVLKQPETDTKDKTQATALPCKATFDYYTSYSGEFNFVHTAELNEGAQLTWNFGDGSTSEKASAKHAFTQSGTYEVTLTVTDQKNTCSFSNSIVYRNPNEKTTPITISGKVVAGSNTLKNAPVELFRYDELKGKYKSVQTWRTNHSGEYTITIERNTRYIIKGYPTGDAQSYAATYWGNATESENASEIMVMPSEKDELFGYTIQLAKTDEDPMEVPAPIASSAPEFQQVFLVDANNRIVSVGTVDSKGNYNFGDNVNAGDYKIVNPSNGVSTPASIPASGNGVSGNNPALGAPSTASPSAASGVVNVFPNPASSVVNFSLESDQSEMATLVIMDASGIERSRQQVVFSSGRNETQYDISRLSPGIYYLLIFRNNKQVSSSRIVKTTGDSKE